MRMRMGFSLYAVVLTFLVAAMLVFPAMAQSPDGTDGVPITRVLIKDLSGNGNPDALLVMSSGFFGFHREIMQHPELLQLPQGFRIDTLIPGLDSSWILLAETPAVVPANATLRVLDFHHLADFGFFEPGEYVIEDGLAPHLVKAWYIPERPAHGKARSGTQDTLRVELSEPGLLLDEFEPFEAQGSNGQSYTFWLDFLDKDARFLTFRVLAVVGRHFPSPGDSLSLRPGTMRDIRGNIQLHPENPTVPIELLPLPAFTFVRTGPSLSLPTGEKCPEEAAFLMRSDGSRPAPQGVAAAWVRQEDWPQWERRIPGFRIEASGPFRLQVTIYDHLGQFVNKVEMPIDSLDFLSLGDADTQGHKELAMGWCLRSRGNVQVATGAYLLRVLVMPPRPGFGSKKSFIRLMRVGVAF